VMQFRHESRPAMSLVKSESGGMITVSLGRDQPPIEEFQNREAAASHPSESIRGFPFECVSGGRFS